MTTPRTLTILPLLALVACVSKARHQELQSAYDELEQTNQALAAQLLEEEAEVDTVVEATVVEQQAELRAFFEDVALAFRDELADGSVRFEIDDDRVGLVFEDVIQFDTGAARLSDDGRGKIDKLAATLREHPVWEIQVVGHTDARPIDNDRYDSNWHLGADRAVRVVQALAGEGVAPGRMTAASVADHEPAAAGEIPAAWEHNRRVEVVFAPLVDRAMWGDAVREALVELDVQVAAQR